MSDLKFSCFPRVWGAGKKPVEEGGTGESGVAEKGFLYLMVGRFLVLRSF